MAKKKQDKTWHEKRFDVYTKGRARDKLITLEESIWLVLGIVFGWFAGKGATILILLIPVVLLCVYSFEYAYFRKHGKRGIHGKRIK